MTLLLPCLGFCCKLAPRPSLSSLSLSACAGRIHLNHSRLQATMTSSSAHGSSSSQCTILKRHRDFAGPPPTRYSDVVMALSLWGGRALEPPGRGFGAVPSTWEDLWVWVTRTVVQRWTVWMDGYGDDVDLVVVTGEES